MSSRLIYAKLSSKPLKITPPILKRLLTYHQVMPAFIDFIAVFAHPPQQREIGFSGFFDQTVLSYKAVPGNVAQQQPPAANTAQPLAQAPRLPRGPTVSALGRSGRQYQLCYNLKRVALIEGSAKDKYSEQEWSVQQSEFHHQFDVDAGTTLWMNAKGRLNSKGGSKDYRDRVLELTGGQAGVPNELTFDTTEDCFRSSLTVHLMNCHWATDDWRGYLNHLEVAIGELTNEVPVGIWLNQKFTPRVLQDVQQFEEKASSAVMVLESNMEVMTELRKFYEKLMVNADFPMKDSCVEEATIFIQQLNDMIHAFARQKRRAKLLVEITENRKNLLLQKLQSLATKKMEDLTTLSYREAIVMKIIAAGTFIFLPATFVSTFFSTDVVKYQDSTNGKGSFSWAAMNIWLEVTLPLTFATFIIGFVAFYVADERRKRRMPSSYDEKNKNP
ncbi:hypothetical protein EJ04DRAFT_173320 [Polyplosphaeria fusca]|uniref:CorA-like transporter domain-containing protein n=1 Tax=Polyplosphaeria fusca TaxID=682080 RepID=A0A9P4QKV3_9PLEO|nr:hypothetical protein EJ04DRAFT_173320 [Polyplosphaeria fusca]